MTSAVFPALSVEVTVKVCWPTVAVLMACPSATVPTQDANPEPTTLSAQEKPAFTTRFRA